MVPSSTSAIFSFFSSITALSGFSRNVAYATGKAGLVNLARHIAVHYGREGIRCNCICPGTVQTPSLDDRIAAQGVQAVQINTQGGCHLDAAMIGQALHPSRHARPDGAAVTDGRASSLAAAPPGACSPAPALGRRGTRPSCR